MPVYEYQCEECGKIEESFQRISDPPLETCSGCSGNLKKLISQSSFHLKGSGWYVTDYAGGKGQKSGTGSDSKKTSTSKSSKTTSKTAKAPK